MPQIRATGPLADFAATDFCDPTVYDDPWELYRWLRHESPVHRDDANELWVVGRHDDVFAISRDPERYCSRFGVRPRLAVDLSLIAQDGEEHTRMRRLINRGFTPRRVRELIPHVREITDQTIAEVAGRGQIDFVEDFAIHVPLIVICELLGLDPETRAGMYRWSDAMMAGDGHTEAEDPVLVAAATAFGEYSEVCQRLIADRRSAAHKDDLIGVLTAAYDEGGLERGEAVPVADATAEILGEPLEDQELMAFLTLLLVAGNETTRNALTGGLLALSRFPDERQRLIDNLDDGSFVDLAVDEIIRYVSPVLSFTRTVTVDHDYRGHHFRDGDKVLLLYPSANRDENVFQDPDRLILDRDPNPHLAFGTGPHYCLGANLARMEVRVVLEQLFAALPDIHVPDGSGPRRGASSLVLALQHLPAAFTPVGAGAGGGCPVHP